MFSHFVVSEDCKKLGINVDGYNFKDLRFADDIALFTGSENDLQTLIERVHDSTFLDAYRNAEDRNRWADFVHGANVLWDTVQR